ncbi:hypothetical protein FGG08_005314 [Glutinoglossum americanum]|uniref:Cleavage/polyadenylation specificity factor A subunit N-terminal domain-containing protein n=1 Tax=Glutinoglossum americanum TaxID=1670608 RepID=A0A9P8L1X6_9PEZI|nr:hypothetical protein FGG08_005314 [Glutinoglossum americanum]
MSFETRVLVDGAWVTRTVDLQTVLDLDREASPRTRPQLPMPNGDPPNMGVLTKTLVRSPVVLWIIPARIRHEDKNDVLFIGLMHAELYQEKFVQIRELHFDGHLRDIAIKTDFGSSIRHAQVFGTPRKPTTRGLDAVIKKELEAGLEAVNGSQSWTRDKHGKAGLELPMVPPQILVLTLESADIVFLFAYHTIGPNSRVEFFTCQRSLPGGRSFLEKLGEIIAVDPKSRALAVAACENTFTLYSLQSMAEIRSKVERNGELDARGFNPIKEVSWCHSEARSLVQNTELFVLQERHFLVEGIILKMEFLYPAPDDEQQVILLLCVHRDQRTRLLVYEWDVSHPLHTVKRHGNHGLRLSDRDRMPLLLIPLTISPAFLLVSECTIAVYKLEDVLEGGSKPRFRGEFPKDPKDPVAGRLPTAWARPVRTERYASKHDDIFISREDGLVLFAEINSDDPFHLHASMCAGPLGCNIDTAFASLDLGMNRDDLLIAGGDMSVGGLYLVRPRQDPEFVESVSNWTPIADFVAADVRTGNSKREIVHKSNSRRDRIFACTGRGAHGCVTELQFGMEARIGTFSEYLPGINQIWSFPDLAGSGTLFLFSFPLRSSLLHMSADWSDIQEMDEDTSGMHLECRTLAAGAFGDHIVQITERSVFVYQQQRSLTSPTVMCFTSHVDPTEEKFVSAAFEESTYSIITAVERDGEYQLQATRVVTRDGRGTLCVFVGARERRSSLQIFRLDLDLGLKHIVDQDFSSLPITANSIMADEFPICHSVAVVEDTNHRPTPQSSGLILLCGLRGGMLVIFDITLDHFVHDLYSDVSIKPRGEIRIGETSVTIVSDIAKPSSAFIICGPDLCRLELNESKSTPVSVSNVWFTDRNEPCYKQSPITAITRMHQQLQIGDDGQDRSVVCVSGNKLIISKLDETLGTITRHISVDDTPRRVLYSKFLNLLVVAISETKSRPAAQGHSYRPEGSNEIMSSLKFIHPDSSGQILLHRPLQNNNISESGERNSSGRIFGLMDWEVTHQDKTYHYILVNTGTLNTHNSLRECGNISILTVKHKNGELEYRQRHVINRDKPVFSVAAYGSCSLVFGSGTRVCYQKLLVEEKRFGAPVEHNLRSSIVHISVKEPFIYASTASDSLSILSWDGTKLVPQFSDEVARSGLYHLTLPTENVTLATDKEGTVTGRRHEAAAVSIFEAEMPGSIVRLKLASVRPPWWPRVEYPAVYTVMGESGRKMDIIGTTIDGSLIQFTLLHSAAWRLLRFIQNLCMRNANICPFDNDGARSHIEPQQHKRFMHVDGDILMRLFEAGREELDRMLMIEPKADLDGVNFTDFDSAAARVDRFRELVFLVLKGFENDPVGGAMECLKDFLQPIL